VFERAATNTPIWRAACSNLSEREKGLTLNGNLGTLNVNIVKNASGTQNLDIGVTRVRDTGNELSIANCLDLNIDSSLGHDGEGGDNGEGLHCESRSRGQKGDY
jgi:hypothetical protein